MQARCVERAGWWRAEKQRGPGCRAWPAVSWFATGSRVDRLSDGQKGTSSPRWIRPWRRRESDEVQPGGCVLIGRVGSCGLFAQSLLPCSRCACSQGRSPGKSALAVSSDDRVSPSFDGQWSRVTRRDTLLRTLSRFPLPSRPVQFHPPFLLLFTSSRCAAHTILLV